MKISVILLMLVFSFAYLQLSANDTTATVAAGIIEYTKSDDISMDQEILKISCEKIEVSYVFTNHSLKPVTTKVAFPLPSYPSTSVHITTVASFWNRYDNKPFLDCCKDVTSGGFTRTVNGEEKGSILVTRAIDSAGQDITDFLIKNNIPLDAAWRLNDDMYIEADDNQENRDLKAKLEKLGLIKYDEKTMNDSGKVNWQLHQAYVWDETFPSNKSIQVYHSYKPDTGFDFLTGESNPQSLDELKLNDQSENTSFNDFNIDEATEKRILSLASKEKNGGEAQVALRTNEVRYVLSTGANWKGPIKSFQLEITPPSPDCICITSLKKPLEKSSDGKYICKIDNYNPQKDLRVIFIHPPYLPPNVLEKEG